MPQRDASLASAVSRKATAVRREPPIRRSISTWAAQASGQWCRPAAGRRGPRAESTCRRPAGPGPGLRADRRRRATGRRTLGLESAEDEVDRAARRRRRARQAPEAHADRVRPHPARHRRDHRHRHLRAHRHGGREPGRARDHALVHAGRARLRVRRAVLRGVRVDDPDRRQRLHLRLRDARRDRRVDDRLGPDPRVRGRLDDRRDRLERLLPALLAGFGFTCPPG